MAASCCSSSLRQPWRLACSVAVAGLLVAVARGAAASTLSGSADAVFTGRQLLQTATPSPPDCIVKNCLKEAVACQADQQCASSLGCAANCTGKINPKKPESWFACISECLYKYSLDDANYTALNVCNVKNKCLALPDFGAPRICLPPKGGASKIKAEDLRGRYNVLAGATKLLDCEPAQFRFGYPKAGYFTYQTYPRYLKPKLIKLQPYKFTGQRFDFTSYRGVLAGLPDINKGVLLDATKGNKYVLFMYCNQGTNIIGGYVLGKGATTIPKAVRQRFAKKLRDSVWAAYYDLPLHAFCTVAARKFP